MCDTEMHFDKPNFALSAKMLIEDQRAASLSYLAFWSNPAWFQATSHSALPAAAIKEWVYYHRLSIASNKETIAEIIGSVKEVIPNSKLVKYGNFRYDFDYEDMYCIAEDLSSRSYSLKANKSAFARRYDFWASETKAHNFGTRDNGDLYTDNKNNIADLCRRIRSLGEWLKELNQVLLRVKKIANEAQLMDSWTETLLKCCLRFVCSLRNNENLIKLLNSEISFILDYEKFQKTPILKVELLSIPQPELKGNVFQNNESVDALWLKLSSSQIRNIWKKDMRVSSPFDSEIQSSKHLVPLIKTNFLRSHRSKRIPSSRQITDILIDIPKNKEIQLLGSLLNVINEEISQPGDILTKMDAVGRNNFPEAHGEWTKNLFPHRVNLPKFEKDSAVWKPRNTVSISQVPNEKVKLEHECSETAPLPIQYYQSVPPPKLSVPPPTLAARFRLPLLNSQPENKFILMPLNDLTSNPSNQQVQYKIPAGPISCIQPAACALQASFCQNYSAPQRFTAPTYADVTGQYQRLNFFQVPHHYHNLQNAKEPQNHQLEIKKNSCPEKISTEKCLKEENKIYDNLESKTVNIPNVSTNAPFVQLSCGYNIPFRIQQNTGNAIAIANKTPQSVISNPQVQMRESRIPLKMSYPVTSIRCRTSLITNTPSFRNPTIYPQLVSKQRFLCPNTINSLQKRRERLSQKRHQYDYTNNPSNRDIQKPIDNARLHSQDKVEKWLDSVNKYVKSGSCINLEELPELPNIKLSKLSNIELPEHPRIELPEHPRIELPEVSRIELPKVSRIELPKVSRIDLSELSKIELPKFCRIDLSEPSSIELPEHPTIELPDIHNKLHGGEKGDYEESEKFEDENASEVSWLNLSQDEMKLLFNTPSNIIEKSYVNKANYFKQKKIKAKREFFEHLQQFQDIALKLKSCKNLRKKIKIAKKYFVQISKTSTRRFHFENFIKVLEKKNHFIRTVRQLKKNEFSTSRQQCCLGMIVGKQLSSGRNLDMRQSDLLINDISKYKMLIYESQKFNTFPSKRMKLNKSQLTFFETKSLIRDQRGQWISSLNYFDSIIDELFFAANGIEGMLSGNQKKITNAEVNGWTHFKVAVKTVMKNLISSLNVQNS